MIEASIIAICGWLAQLHCKRWRTLLIASLVQRRTSSKVGTQVDDVDDMPGVGLLLVSVAPTRGSKWRIANVELAMA